MHAHSTSQFRGGFQNSDSGMTPRRLPTVSEESLAAMVAAQAVAWVGRDGASSRAARVLEVTLDGVRIRYCVGGAEEIVVPVSASWTLRDVPGDLVIA